MEYLYFILIILSIFFGYFCGIIVMLSPVIKSSWVKKFPIKDRENLFLKNSLSKISFWKTWLLCAQNGTTRPSFFLPSFFSFFFPPSLLSFLPAFLLSFLLSFFPSFRPFFPSFFPSLLPSFLLSFLSSFLSFVAVLAKYRRCVIVDASDREAATGDGVI